MSQIDESFDRNDGVLQLITKLGLANGIEVCLGSANQVFTLEFAMSIANLTTRERAVIRYQYLDRLTFSEIGNKFNVSKERIRQILAVAERKLRANQYAREILLKGPLYFFEEQVRMKVEFELKRMAEEARKVPILSATSTIDDADISSLDLSVRPYNCLKRAKVNTIGDLRSLLQGPRSKVISIRHLGVKSLREIEKTMLKKGLWDGLYAAEGVDNAK